MSMTIEQAKSELMQIYGALSPDKQRAIDTVLHINVVEHDKDHIWYKGKQYISLSRFLQVKEPCEDEYIKVPKKALKYRTAGMVAYNAEWLKDHFDIERVAICGEQEPCEDAISRKDVEECKELMTDINGDTVYAVRMSDIRQLSSVNPQEPKTDVLDKIRAESEELKNEIRKEHNYGADAVYGGHVIDGINAVLQIIDKYKAESEEVDE